LYYFETVDGQSGRIGHHVMSRVMTEFKHEIDIVVVQTRDRHCSNPTPANRGLPCEGEMKETLLCTNDPCPGVFKQKHQYLG